MCDEEVEAEEIMLEAYDGIPGPFYDPIKRYEMPGRKNSDTINNFGKRAASVEAFGTASYYGKLLAWTVNCIITFSGWKSVLIQGYSSERPVFWDIQTDYTKNESCIIDGQMLLEKADVRLVITIVARFGFIEIEAGEEHLDLIRKLIKDIADFIKEHNFYKGKKISFSGEISFLNAGQMDWSSIILDHAMKNEIRLNTIGFLKNCARLAKYRVPPKRGIILAGDPAQAKQ